MNGKGDPTTTQTHFLVSQNDLPEPKEPTTRTIPFPAFS
jgi:hypothetical protein